jgi:uncharacterized protein YxjI
MNVTLVIVDRAVSTEEDYAIIDGVEVSITSVHGSTFKAGQWFALDDEGVTAGWWPGSPGRYNAIPETDLVY